MNLYKRFLRWLFPPTEFKRRLSDKLPVLHAEIEAFKLEAGADWDKKSWLKIADNLFNDLKGAVGRYDIQEGWKIYKDIGRLLIHGLDKMGLMSRGKAIFYEALGKMEPEYWRRKAILELLGKVDASTPEQWVFNEEATVENIVKANEILDEHQDNFYDKLLTLNGQIRLLTWMAVFAIATFIIIAPKVGDFPPHATLSSSVVDQMTEFLRSERNRDSLKTADLENRLEEAEQGGAEQTDGRKTLPKEDSLLNAKLKNMDSLLSVHESKLDSLLKAKQGKPDSTARADGKECRMCAAPRPIHENPRRLAVMVILMGIIGATVSGFLGIIETGTENAIPNQLFGTTILTARLVLATVAALAVYIFLGTGLLLLFSSKISFELLLAFCFAAGFSETIVKKGFATLTKEEMYKGQKPK